MKIDTLNIKMEIEDLKLLTLLLSAHAQALGLTSEMVKATKLLAHLMVQIPHVELPTAAWIAEAERPIPLLRNNTVWTLTYNPDAKHAYIEESGYLLNSENDFIPLIGYDDLVNWFNDPNPNC